MRERARERASERASERERERERERARERERECKTRNAHAHAHALTHTRTHTLPLSQEVRHPIIITKKQKKTARDYDRVAHMTKQMLFHFVKKQS